MKKVSPIFLLPGISLNDYGAYAYKTNDYGKTWVKINDRNQADDFLRVIREDKKLKAFYTGGSERAFYISYNGGSNWQADAVKSPCGSCHRPDDTRQ
jgi:photosystem II stability/assembly factor-like uncharacterized protein